MKKVELFYKGLFNYDRSSAVSCASSTSYANVASRCGWQDVFLRNSISPPRDIRERTLSRRIIIAYPQIEFVLLDTVRISLRFPRLVLIRIKKILLTVIQTVKSHVVSTASVSRDDVPERGSWTYDSLVRSLRILRVPPRKRYCYNRQGVFEENRVATRRPMAGTGRRKGLYRRLVYWVACDRWKKVSLSAASSEIPRRPWRTMSLAIPFSTAGSRRLFVRAVRARCPRRSRDKVKKSLRLNERFKFLKVSFKSPQWVAPIRWCQLSISFSHMKKFCIIDIYFLIYNNLSNFFITDFSYFNLL